MATTQLTVDSKDRTARTEYYQRLRTPQTAKNSLASAKAALAQAEAQLASARNDLSYTTITSPSDGAVGTILFPGQPWWAPPRRAADRRFNINKIARLFRRTAAALALTARSDGSVNSMIGAMPDVQLQSTMTVERCIPPKARSKTLSGVIDLSTGAVQSAPPPLLTHMPAAQRWRYGTVLTRKVLRFCPADPAERHSIKCRISKFGYVPGDSSKVKIYRNHGVPAR